VLVLALSLPSFTLAQSSPLPQRKPGWWELQVTIQGATATPAKQVMKLCTDPAIDRVQSPFGINQSARCPPIQATRTAAGWDVASTCPVAGMTVSTQGHATGDFESRYHVDLITRTTPPITPQTAEIKIGMDATWLGPCPADKKPGDVEMTMNLNVAPGAGAAAKPNP
jgi:hypothetical protein